MLASKARRSGLVAALIIVAACSSSTMKVSMAKDAGTSSPDLGPGTDLPADSKPVTADAGIVLPASSPDAPVLDRDSASLDATIRNDDAGLDGRRIRKDAPVDRIAYDGALDQVQPPICTGTLVLGNPPLANTGRQPNAVATGDLNGDGMLDIVTANEGASTVSVLLGTGGGGLAAKVDYACGGGANSVVLGDLNGDGKLDIVTANRGGSVSVLFGTGDGTFAANVDYAAGDGTVSVALGDLNGDGLPDLVATNIRANPSSVSVLLGIGGGRFAAKVDYPTAWSPESVAVGDLNGDGTLDIVTVNWSGSASVLMGKGDGTFAAKVDYPLGYEPTSVALGDLNGDGKLDLVAENSGTSSVSVLLGKGDGTFAAKVEYPTGQHEDSDSPDGTARGLYSPTTVALSDLNGDGKLDIVATNVASYDVSVLLGKGDGTFATHVDYKATGSPSAVALGDLNGDHTLDIVTANSETNAVAVLAGKGDGSFTIPNTPVYPIGGDPRDQYSPRSIALGDVNSDGRLDMVASNYAPGTVSVLLGKGDGTFAVKQDYPVGGSPVSAALGDLNGDGKLDIVSTSDTAATVSVLLGKGDGTFATKADYPTRKGSTSMALGDLNGDGILDIVVANSVPSASSTSVSVLLGKGDGTFAANVDYPTSEWTEAVVLGDVDGDGLLDIVTANLNGNTLSVLFGNGDGTFADKVDVPTGNSFSLALGDLNGDGTLDIVTPNLSNYGVSVLLGTGDGTFFPRVNYPTAQDTGTVALADLNGDGKLDIVATNEQSGSVTVMLGSGDGNFTGTLAYATGATGNPLALGDLNGDGRLDLVVSGNPTSVSVLLGACQ